MIKQRLEVVREKIDRYAREAVQRELKSQVETLTETYLRPIAEDFLTRTLEAYLKRHLSSSLEEAVSALEDVFDGPSEDPGVAYEPEEEPDPFGTSEEGSFLEQDDTYLKNKLLAYIQVYQTENNTEFAPKQKGIADGTGLKSMQIIRYYSDLRDEGRIVGPTKKGRHSVIRILKPLSDPGRYL